MLLFLLLFAANSGRWPVVVAEKLSKLAAAETTAIAMIAAAIATAATAIAMIAAAVTTVAAVVPLTKV